MYQLMIVEKLNNTVQQNTELSKLVVLWRKDKRGAERIHALSFTKARIEFFRDAILEMLEVPPMLRFCSSRNLEHDSRS